MIRTRIAQIGLVASRLVAAFLWGIMHAFQGSILLDVALLMGHDGVRIGVSLVDGHQDPKGLGWGLYIQGQVEKLRPHMYT